MSAVMTSGHGRGRGVRPDDPALLARATSSPPTAWRRAGAGGCRRARPAARSRSRECSRGAPGGLWAGSCSSIRTSVAGGGSGASSAERVPTTTRARPREAANQAAAPLRLGDAAVEPGGVEPSRPARGRLAVGRDDERGAGLALAGTRRAGPRAAASVQSSGARGGPGAGAAGGDDGLGRALRAAGGGSSESRVEPHDERLSAAAQRPSSSAASREHGHRLDGALQRLQPGRDRPRGAPTTTPTRARPWSGALTRCPRRDRQPVGHDVGERMIERNIEDDVGDHERARAERLSGRWARQRAVRRSYSRRASLRSSQAMRLYSWPGLRSRKAGWKVGHEHARPVLIRLARAAW